MKNLILPFLMLLIVTACAQGDKKKMSKADYNSTLSFMEEGKKYEAKVQLPKDFKDRVPLVVIVHEWWGRTPYPQSRADQLNAEGFATLPVDLFGNGQTVDNPKDAMGLAGPFYKDPEMGIRRLTQYISQAKNDPHVDPSKVYVIGYCFGGTQALNLARSGADVKGVVSFHGGLTSTLKPKNVKARVLALNGASDPMVPPKDVKVFEEEMKANNISYRSVNYPNATHAFTNPMATEIGKKFNIPIAYHKEADEASWKELLKFLRSP